MEITIKNNDKVTLKNHQYNYKFTGTARVDKFIFIENGAKTGGYVLTQDLIEKWWDEVIIN